MNVLVTIGSMIEKKFTRLFKIIDELCEEGVLDGSHLKAQVGFDDYKSDHFKSFDMIADEDFKKMIDECDLIITHAGTGTVVSSIKKRKKVIVFPRMEKYGEHYDNHQLELANLFASQGYVLQARNKEELKYHIQHIQEFVPVEFISNNERMNKLIINLIENRGIE